MSVVTDSTIEQTLHSDSVDEVIAFETRNVGMSAGDGVRYDVDSDRAGSITAIVESATDTILARYDYAGVGERSQVSGSFNYRYGYTGRDNDAESGLVYLRLRYMDPNSGTFIQSDPIGFDTDSPHVYSYVDNNSFNRVDPTGLTPTVSKVAKLKGSTSLTAGAMSGVAPGVFTQSAIINGRLAGMGKWLQMANVKAVGAAGEQAVRGRYFRGLKRQIMINGRLRIPDGILAAEHMKILTEIKNVARQAYTRQLRDYADYAKRNGFDFFLCVRPNKRLSQSLKNAEKAGDVIIRLIR